jgi:hypothetical protein
MLAYEAGSNRISYDESKGYNLTTHQGLFQGPRDTPPPANPGTGGGSSGAGGSGITANTTPSGN